MYRDEYHPQVRRDLKRLDKNLVLQVREKHIPNILESPLIGENLVGDLHGIRSYHFRYSSTQYRIAYFFNEEERVVQILMIAKRENFYQILQRRIR